MTESRSDSEKLGKIDRNILRVLQKDGRISYTDLAREVGLSVTPCIERVKRLERNGYILGYTATVSPERLDASLVVFVQIRLNTHRKKTSKNFIAQSWTLKISKAAFWYPATTTTYLKPESKTWQPIESCLAIEY